MKVKTFRGLIADDTQVRIRLGTNDGLTGYKINKFQLIGINENKDYEATVQVFNTEQATVTADITFDNPLLLAAALYGDETGGDVQSSQTVIFDNVKFNQDIYVTYKTKVGSESINYYLELEQVKLNLDEATVATLKDMRGRE